MVHHKTNAELAADARRSLLGHLSTAVWSLVLFTGISMSMNQIFTNISIGNKEVDLVISLVVRFVTSTFGSLFGVGLASVFLKLQINRSGCGLFLQQARCYVCFLFRFFFILQKRARLLPDSP